MEDNIIQSIYGTGAKDVGLGLFCKEEEKGRKRGDRKKSKFENGR